jgi:hypothetical protein
MHGDVGGSSSIMFKSNNGQNDYAYIEYDENVYSVQSLLKYDLSSNTPSFIGTSSPVVYATLASTGTSSSTIGFGPHDNSFAWVSNTTALNGVTPAYCILFNQTNLSTTDTTSRVNFLVNSNLPNFSSFTFSAWIRPGTITPVGGATPVRWMIANLNNTSNDGVIDIWLESDGKIYGLLGDDYTNYIRTNTQLQINTWYHLVFTFDNINKNGYIYINGTLDTFVAGTGLSGKSLKPNSNLVIGMKYGWNTGTGTNTVYTSAANHIKGFRGQMVFLNVFNVPLTASEVSYLYNNPSYSSSTDRGLMTIGIENDGGYINNDRIALWPNNGTGFVGVNTKTPQTALDVNGTLNTNSDAVINGMRVGRGPGNNIGNVAFGENALHINSITNGYQNSAIGYQTLRLNTEGYQNSAVGYQALNTNTTGNNNTAVGALAIKGLTANSNNTAIGFSAGNYNNSTNVGDKNTFLGALTGLDGNYSESTAIGFNARITASNQIVLGRNSETVYVATNLLLQSPSDNHCYIRNVLTNTNKYLYLGANNQNVVEIRNNGITVTGTTTANGPATTYANRISNPLSGGLIVTGTNGGRIVLGSYLTPGSLACAIQASDYYSDLDHGAPLLLNQLGGAVGIGVSTITSGYLLEVSGAVKATSYNASSDYRIKKNVMPLNLTFNVDLLKPVSYVLKDDKDARLNIGFIAHEVQEVYPFLVNGVKDGSFNQSINYNGFIGILTKEIQELKKKVLEQEARIAEQEARIAEQEARIAEQEAKALEQEARIQALEKMMLDLINK